MALPLFKDLGKRASDLLTKEFPSEKREQKAEWKSTTPSGVKLEFNIASVGVKDGYRTTGTVKNEYFYKPWATTFTGEVNTDKEVKLEASATERFLKGLKSTVTLQSKLKDGSPEYFETVGFEYRHENASATLSADIGRSANNALKASLVVGSQGVAVGTSAEYDRSEAATTLKELKSSVSYTSAEFEVVAYGRVLGKDKKSGANQTQVGATYYHAISQDFAVGTELAVDVNNPAKKPTLAFATAYRPLLDSVFKGKFDTEGKLAVSFAQRVNPRAKLLLSATVDTNAPSSPSGTQFGFTLSLND